MSAVQLHCPLCDGLFQVDDSLAGIEVNCPHCQGLVAVPDLSEPPPSSTALELSCPVCTGPFQVLSEFAGQQVHCPHCQQVVAVPQWSELSAGGFAPPPTPPLSQSPPLPLNPLLPPDPLLPPVSTPLPTRDLYPPGYQPRPAAAAPVPVESRDLYPPGYKPPPTERPEQRRDSPAPKPSPSIDPMLPPSTGGAVTKRQEPADLLPPGAATATGPIERKPLPASIPKRAKDEFLIPTERGYVGIHEPVKTVQHRGEEVALRKLTPEEKARRRVVRNTILFAFCILTLIVVTALFMWK